MSVADIALYVAIFGKLGIIPLAVTTSLTINFLRRPARRRSWKRALDIKVDYAVRQIRRLLAGGY